MAGIFISYRQADAKAWAIALRDGLAQVFGEDQVFLDKDTLHAGNWRRQIHLALERCTVVLLVVGPRWLTILDEQNRPRISLAEDVHHQEIALALDRSGVTVIPVLVDDASMPRAEQLPTDLQSLCDQQAFKIDDSQARRKADLEVLIQNIQAIGGLKARAGTTNASEVESPAEGPSWFRPDIMAIGIAFVLTVCSAMLAYLSNVPFGREEPLVLLLLFYAMVFGAKRVWRMRVERKKGAL